MKIEQYSRILHHRLTGEGRAFTNPTSNDHTDGTWRDSDLYIGEIGINVTDDKMYFRSNNGIIELGNATPSSTVQPWVYSTNEITISPTYSVYNITRNSNAFTDLGSSTLRFKDLYLGGSSDGLTTININSGFSIVNSTDTLITTTPGGSNNASIIFGTESSSDLKSLGLHINSNSGTFSSGANAVTSISSTNYEIEDNCDNISLISANDIIIASGSNNLTYIGEGYGREIDGDNITVIGGELWIRSFDDDGTEVYLDSELKKGQSRITTTDATYNDILAINFPSTSGGVINISARVTGMDEDNPEECYFIDIFSGAFKDTIGTSIADDPIIKEINLIDPEVEVVIEADGNDEVAIKVKGVTGKNIKWVCNYEYNVLLNNNI